MSDDHTPDNTPDDNKPNRPARNWGVVEWGILIGILGLIIYGQFFGGGPC